jgi:AcrR family transcriptional regulator
MDKDILIKEKILNAAEKRMIKFGYRKVTMDEIAQDLHMSKNTIYKLFVGKEEIAKALIKRLQHQLNTCLVNIEKAQNDPLRIFSDSVLLLRKQLGPWFEHFFREIPTELPSLWEEFLHYRNEKILDIRSLVEKGSKNGVFRRVNPSIATEAYLGAVKAIMNQRFLEQENLTFEQALDAVLDIWSNGIWINRNKIKKEMKSTSRKKYLLLSVAACALAFAVPIIAKADTGSTVPAVAPDTTIAGSQQAEPAVSSDNDMMDNWLAKVSEIQSEQPHWVTPLMTVTPRLEQEIRYDQYWESSAGNHNLDSYGGGKGLEFIPFQNTEVIVGIPAYETRNTPDGTSGFADESLLFKYRLLSANEENGDYILTAFLGVSIPSGNKYNTEDHEITTPTLAAGKGWGNFDIQDTVGVQIPDNGATGGTPVVSNTAFQYRIAKWATPELEFNYTYWPNGDREGINQLYITPGIVLGKFDFGKRVGLTVGVGYQIAATTDSKYNHNVVLSVRMPF